MTVFKVDVGLALGPIEYYASYSDAMAASVKRGEWGCDAKVVEEKHTILKLEHKTSLIITNAPKLQYFYLSDEQIEERRKKAMEKLTPQELVLLGLVKKE
jgi:hypothetical protein